MAFNDLQLKVAAESAIQAAHANLAKLSLFAKSYSELNGTYGMAVQIPVYDLSAAGDFVEATNNYGSGVNEVEGTTLTLSSHIVKSVSITDRQLAETGINWVKDTTFAVADTLTRKVNKTVFEMICDDANVLTSDNALTSKALIAELYKVASDNDIPVDRCVVALNPTYFAKVLGMLDANIYGGSEAIRLGVVPNLFGFKGFVCSTYFKTGTNGAIIMDTAIGTAARYLAPMTPGAYPEAWMASDGDTMPIGFRRFADLATGRDYLAGDILFGAKVLQPKKIVKFV